MKKIMNKVNFALVALMASAAPAMAASGGDAICDLVEKLGGILDYIRIFAFIGAGFMIAQWAWGFIKDGEVKMDTLKDKGAGLLVGCFLLFLVGALLSFLISAAGPNGALCADQFKGW